MNTPHNPPVPHLPRRRRHPARSVAPLGVLAVLLVGACDSGDTSTTPAPDGPAATNAPLSTNPRNDGLNVIAFDDAGRIVQISPETLEPEVLFDVGPLNDRWETIDVSLTNNVGFITTCCEPATGAVYEVRTTQDPPLDPAPTPGYGVSISPNDQFVAIGQFTGNPVSIKNLATDEWVESDPLPAWADMAVGEFTPADVMWVNDERLLVLGTMLPDPDADGDVPEYVIYDVTVDNDGQLISASDATRTWQTYDADQPMSFAGRLEPFDSAWVGLYARGSSSVVMFDPISGDQNVLGTQPNLVSIWYDPGPYEVAVDADGLLTIDTKPVEGTYAWARTT